MPGRLHVNLRSKQHIGYEIIIEMTLRLNLSLLQDALKEKHNNHDRNHTFTEDFPTAEPAAPIDPTLMQQRLPLKMVAMPLKMK
jgi:hypothetical protein